MKTFIVAVVLVLGLAGAGWEETVWERLAAITAPAIPQVDTNNMVTAHSSTTTGGYAVFGFPPRQVVVEVECQEPQGLPLPVCVKKMEAAMRAMEPIIPPYFDPMDALIGKHPQKFESQISDQRMREAYQEWEAVKLECWRQP